LATAGAGLTLIGDVINLGAASSVTATGSPSFLFFKPSTVGRPVVVGGAARAGSLVFSDTNRAAISGFTNITIGDINGFNTQGRTGPITTAGNLTRSPPP